MMLVGKDSGIATPQDLKGHTAMWFAGNEYPFFA